MPTGLGLGADSVFGNMVNSLTMVYNRKATIFYSFICLMLWIGLFVSAVMTTLPGVSYEWAVAFTILFGIGMILLVLLSVVMALIGVHIPAVLPLGTLATVMYLVLTWGVPMQFKGLSIFAMTMLSLPVCFWYLFDTTRERSGDFQ